MRSRLPLAVLPFAAQALAREIDGALGLVLRAEVVPDGLLRELGRALAADGTGALTRAAVWLSIWGLASLAVWCWGRRAQAQGLGRARATIVVWPLLLRPAITLLALVSVALRPSYPYAFTLPVALTQDWGIAQDLAALAALAAAARWAPRFPAPRTVEVFALAFLAYGALVPEWAWQWDSHPGNEPKTLRQAVALGHWLTFDAEPVSRPMEKLDVRPLAATVPGALATVGRESWQMLVAVAQGDAGKDAIRATRLSRQLVRGKEGGVYSVLAPGPALLLAPSLRADRALNRARGVEGRVAVSVLAFCAFGAGLVAAVFRLVREATGRAGLAAALALGFAVVPPGLFYFYQFYPEMLGALVLALAFLALALEPESALRHPWRLGLLLSLLPWLHQKFLPVWLVLVATALVVAWRSRDSKRLQAGLGLVLPTLASGFLFALYNFAITGSVRPDALFLAWGPGGVSGARVGQGLLGLVLDARYGLLPYVPLLLLAAAGFVTGGARRFAVILPAAFVYYLTVASADNWAGAVCNLGRYAMPLVPLATALVGIAIARCDARRGAMALALTLAAWTAVLALALRQDPHAANDSALLLAKSTFADGLVYIPGLHVGSWADAAPGLWLRVLAWLVLTAALAWWWTHASKSSGPEGAGGSPRRALFGVAGLLLLVGFGLEHAAPASRMRPAWPGVLAAGPGTTLFLDAATVREDEAIVGPGEVQILVRAEKAQGSLPLTMGGEGFLYVPGRAPQALRPTGALVDLPLSAYHEVRGRDRTVAFSRTLVRLEREAVLRPASMEPPGPEVR